MSEHTQKAIEAERIKNEILERFKPYLQCGSLDFTQNLSAQMELYANAKAEVEEKDKQIEELKNVALGKTAKWYSNLLEEKDKRIGELEEALRELKAWKESSLSVTPDMQAIGKALGVKLGESVHDKILPGIEKLNGFVKDISESYGCDIDEAGDHSNECRKCRAKLLLKNSTVSADKRTTQLKEGLGWCLEYFKDDFLPEDYLKIQQLLNNH